jgi:hypothetical protein
MEEDFVCHINVDALTGLDVKGKTYPNNKYLLLTKNSYYPSIHIISREDILQCTVCHIRQIPDYVFSVLQVATVSTYFTVDRIIWLLNTF